MKFIKLKPNSGFDYPVGKYIVSNLPIIKDYATKLEELLKKEEFKDRDRIIFCRGSSGAIIAGIIASIIEITEIIHIKKAGEKSHSDNNFIVDDNDIVIIVDDFVTTGNTLKSIYNTIENCKTEEKEIDILILNNSEEFAISKINFKPKYFIGHTFDY
jgi:adenine/guanine phosphoribosyltransferase-like PRPP-binding protein